MVAPAESAATDDEVFAWYLDAVSPVDDAVQLQSNTVVPDPATGDSEDLNQALLWDDGYTIDGDIAEAERLYGPAVPTCSLDMPPSPRAQKRARRDTDPDDEEGGGAFRGAPRHATVTNEDSAEYPEFVQVDDDSWLYSTSTEPISPRRYFSGSPAGEATAAAEEDPFLAWGVADHMVSDSNDASDGSPAVYCHSLDMPPDQATHDSEDDEVALSPPPGLIT